MIIMKEKYLLMKNIFIFLLVNRKYLVLLQTQKEIKIICLRSSVGRANDS